MPKQTEIMIRQLVWTVLIPLVLAIAVALLSKGILQAQKKLIQVEAVVKSLEEITDRAGKTSEPYYIVDEEGKCVFITDGMLELLKKSRQDCIGRNMHFVLHHHRRDLSEYPLEDCLMFKAMKLKTLTSQKHDVIWDSRNCMIDCDWISEPFLVRDRVFTRIKITQVHSIDCDNPLATGTKK
ncbi:MAG: hypothetical protein KatS3mg087_1378 [Patescibacteria group bacterium]|nr:MAG: hypothetical protein KatS3mg087_1378 [Patescibacteria group bacterium]